MADDIDLWEQHAGWWQDGFTEGVDPEYTEQILPIAANVLAGYGRILDVGTGEGQVARLAVGQGSSLVVGIDPTANQVAEAASRGGGAHYARSGADRYACPGTGRDGAARPWWRRGRLGSVLNCTGR